MFLRNLIEELQLILEDNDDQDVEVRLAMQPNWPFEYSISPDVVLVDLGDDEDEESDDKVVYLGEGNQVGYLPGTAAEAVWG